MEDSILHIAWKERYNINFKEIDAQHRKLVSICNDLIDLLPRKPDPEQIRMIFTQLKDYALTHFKYEEDFMKKARYPGFKTHQAQHKKFISHLLESSENFDYTEENLIEMINFLKNWYINHIMQSDQGYQPFVHKLLKMNPKV